MGIPRTQARGGFNTSTTYNSGSASEFLLGYPITLRDDAGTPYAGWLTLRERDGALSARFDTINRQPEFFNHDYHPPLPSSSEHPCLSTSAAPTPPAALIVRLRDPRDAEAFTRDHELRLVRHVGDEHTLLLRSDTRELHALTKTLELDPRAVYAEPGVSYQPQALYPTTPYLHAEHHHFHIGTPTAWGIERGEGITVAVIDSGFVLDLHDFDGAEILPGADFCPNFGDDGCEGFSSDPTAHDISNNHGTTVLGVILAQHNALATTGIASAVRALPIKAAPDVTITSYSTAQLVDALLWAAGESVPGAPLNPNPADIINLSLAGASASTPVQQALERLDELGIIVIAAAGNQGNTTLNYPAAYPSVISVAASSQHNPRERVSWSNHGAGLDLIAPGEEILTACYGSVNGIHEQQLCASNGTSLAAPIVTAAAALVLAQNPHYTHTDLRAHLLESTYRDASMHPHDTGAGLLRIDAALGLPAPSNEHDRHLELHLSNATHTITLTTDLLTGIGNDHDATRLTNSGDVTLSFTHDGRTFSATFPLALALVRRPPER